MIAQVDVYDCVVVILVTAQVVCIFEEGKYRGDSARFFPKIKKRKEKEKMAQHRRGSSGQS